MSEKERMLQRIADAFDRVCKRRNLEVNADKSKVMFSKRAKEQIIDFSKTYIVRA